MLHTSSDLNPAGSTPPLLLLLSLMAESNALEPLSQPSPTASHAAVPSMSPIRLTQSRTGRQLKEEQGEENGEDGEGVPEAR